MDERLFLYYFVEECGYFLPLYEKSTKSQGKEIYINCTDKEVSKNPSRDKVKSHEECFEQLLQP